MLQARIDMIHDAVMKGQLRDLQMLLNITSPVYSLLKPKAENLVISKDNAGSGLLHKAVYYDYPEIVAWLVSNYPATVHVRDKVNFHQNQCTILKFFAVQTKTINS